jgi:HD-GYP domain-containing protein (c-di-GMP phosphodiesterase class II)
MPSSSRFEHQSHLAQPTIPTPGLETHLLAEIVPFPSAPPALPEVLAALTYALDLAANEHPGYTLRCCIIGMNLARRLRLHRDQVTELFYALLLNGLGTSRERHATQEWMGMEEALSRHALRGFDWTRIEPTRIRFLIKHAFRNKPALYRAFGIASLLSRRQVAPALQRRRSSAGIRLARKLGMPTGTVEALQSMDERWNGRGGPEGYVYEAVPLLSQICCVAQDLAAFGDVLGRAETVNLIERHSGRWYDPGVVVAVITTHEARTLWAGTDEENLMEELLSRDPQGEPMLCSDDALEEICSAVADVIDSRSRYTATHSHGVAQAATRIGAEMQLSEREMRTLRSAALLHDIGKLTISADILEKETPLTPAQISSVRSSPRESYNILRRIRSFESIALLAKTHHERLDGSGYPDGLQDHQIGRLSRILAMAEAYDALSSSRPYREDYTEEDVLVLLEKEIPHALDAATFDALKRSLHKVQAIARSVDETVRHG